MSEERDAFEVMGVPKHLCLDQDSLQKIYDERSRDAHPDVGGEEEGFDRLRESYDILRRPVRRLRHWLELHGGQVGVMSEGPVLELFDVVGALVQRVDDVLRRREKAKSLLVKSLAEREGIGLLSDLEELLGRVSREREQLEGRFEEFDARGGKVCLEEAGEVAAALIYLDKWEGQLRERWMQLGM